MPDAATVAVRLEVIDPGGAAASDTISLASSPSITLTLSVGLAPEDPHTDSVLTATPAVEGVDSADVSVTFDWMVDGAVVATGPEDTLDGAVYFDRDQTVQVTATATLDDTQTSATSDAVTVQNSAPEAPTLTFTPPHRSKERPCSVR